MKRFENLQIWQKGLELSNLIYELGVNFPNDEKYGIKSQITRAMISVPSNIAEGSSRSSEKENARFIEIALGSAFEVQTLLIIIKKRNWVKEEQINYVLEQLIEEIKMLNSFLKNLRNPVIINPEN